MCQHCAKYNNKRQQQIDCERQGDVQKVAGTLEAGKDVQQQCYWLEERQEVPLYVYITPFILF